MAGLVKYRAEFMVIRAENSSRRIPTGSRRVREVGVPKEVAEGTHGDIGRHIWEVHLNSDPERFVVVVGVQRKHEAPPAVPRVSLPEASPFVLERPYEEAERGIREVEKRGGGRWYGRITLDLDGVRPTRAAVQEALIRGGYPGRYEWRRSASGRGVHVRLPASHHGLEPAAVLNLRLQLGDDPVRVALDASRYVARGDRTDLRGILFDAKGDKSAGEWHIVENQQI